MSTAYRYDEMPPVPSAESVSLAGLLERHEVETFLYYEADLLDQWQYDEWLNIVAEDVRYWMPIRRNVRYGTWDREQSRELEELAWFDENKTTLAMRVRQLTSGIHWAEEPLSRISHMISNVRIVAKDTNADGQEELTARDRFFVYRNRVDAEVMQLVGKRETVLRRTDSGFLIARRSIFLDQSVLLSKNLTFFL